MKVLLNSGVVYGEQSGSSWSQENHPQYSVTAIKFVPNGRRAAESASVVDALTAVDAIGSDYEASCCAAAMQSAGAQVDPQGGW